MGELDDDDLNEHSLTVSESFFPKEEQVKFHCYFCCSLLECPLFVHDERIDECDICIVRLCEREHTR